MVTRRIAFVTGTRAEYGLLRPLIELFRVDPDFKTLVFATGMHLSPEFGQTIRQIEGDGIFADEKIEILLSSDSAVGISKSMGLALIGFGEAYARHSPDAVVILGDRFEAFCAAAAAVVANIPVYHLHGGELSLGAVDDAFRHSITKMSRLHFVATEEYRRRVVQLGEDPETVFNVGAIGVDILAGMKLMTEQEIRQDLGIPEGLRYAVATLHPATLDKTPIAEQFSGMAGALGAIDDLYVVFTLANADAGGREMNGLVQAFCASRPGRAGAFASLGQPRYFSAAASSEFVIGNSSSGLIEVPSLKVPTINIGPRQLGRTRALSVVDCGYGSDEIAAAIAKARDPAFLEVALGAANPYGRGDTARQIHEIIEKRGSTLDGKKRFHDVQAGCGCA